MSRVQTILTTVLVEDGVQPLGPRVVLGRSLERRADPQPDCQTLGGPPDVVPEDRILDLGVPVEPLPGLALPVDLLHANNERCAADSYDAVRRERSVGSCR